MSKLIIDVLIGLPGSGRTTWLQNNNKPNNIFDNIGDTDPDLQKFKKTVSDPTVDRISISEVQFADAKILFQTLTLLHETIESVGREEEYHFVLFQQSEAYCIRAVENQPSASTKIALIRNFSPIINKTFIFLKKNFPRFTKDFRISPISPISKHNNTLDNNIQDKTLPVISLESTNEGKVLFNDNVDKITEKSMDKQEKKTIFSLSNFLRKAS